MAFSILYSSTPCLSLHDFPPIYLSTIINTRTMNEKRQLFHTRVTEGLVCDVTYGAEQRSA